jgi:hypothetical protein
VTRSVRRMGVEERIDIAEAWGRAESVLHRWEESSDRKIVRELEKIRKALERGLDRG